MKLKRIALILTAMTLACAMLLTACGQLTVKEVQKNPFETVCDSIEKTVEACFARMTPAQKIINAMNGGRISALLNMSGSEISADMTIGEDAVKLDAQAKLAGMDTGKVSLFSTGTEMVLSSDALLGGSYGVNLATLREDLKDSALLSTLGVDYDTLMEQVGPMLDQFSGNDEMREKIEAYVNNVKEAFKQTFAQAETTVAEETLSISGKDVKAITVSMKITLDMLCDFLDTFFDETEEMMKLVQVAGSTDEVFAEAGTELEQLRNDNQMNGTLTFALNPKTEQVMVVSFDAVGSAKGEEEEPMKCTLTLGETPAESEAFVLDYYTKDSESTDEGTLTFARVDSENEFSRSLSILDKSAGGEAEEVFSYKRNKQDNTYTLQAADAFAISGAFTVDGNTVKITADKLTVDGEPIEGYSISLTFNGDQENLTKPEYKNIATMDAQEIEALVGKASTTLSPWLAMFGMEPDDGGDDNTDASVAEQLINFDETVDYDGDGDVGDDDDYIMWRDHLNILVVYNEDVDYDGDGDSDDEDDKAAFESCKALYIYNDAFDYDGDGDANADDKFIFDNYLAGFNAEMDYDGDGDCGDNGDYITWQTVLYGEPIE